MWRLAAPSCVWPEDIAGNVRRLAELKQLAEVALTFFHTEACRAYTEADLPPELTRQPLGFHVHLPLDLPWPDTAAVGQALTDLIAIAAPLRPRSYVLHPPQEPELLAWAARHLAGIGVEPLQVAVENIRDNDLSRCWPVIQEHGLAVCVDLGHVLAYGQHSVLELPGLAGRLRMLHLHAPEGQRDRHGPISELDAEGRQLLQRLLAMLPAGGTVVLENFRPEVLEAALAAWAQITARPGQGGLEGC